MTKKQTTNIDEWWDERTLPDKPLLLYKHEVANLISQEKEKWVEVAEKRASKERNKNGITDFWYGMQAIIDLLQNK